MNVSAVVDAIGAGRKITPEQKFIFEQEEVNRRAMVLSYLKAKFPDVDEKVFKTDYAGYVHEEIIDWPTVYKAAIAERACAGCKNSRCEIPKSLGVGNSRPIVKVSESPRGFKFLDVRWTCGLACKFYSLSGDFGRMFKKSGLKNSHINMTFKNYQCSKSTPEIRTAKLEAMNAAEEQSCLIIAGKPGTGKTHLAVAIAIRAMEQGRQTIFRLVSTMLDEIQNTIKNNGDYDGLMKQFMNVPCLVLDDLGHENMTNARASYLHQIIDYRYGENLQTIVTTNANDSEELSRLSNADFVIPIISRLEEHGSWITIRNAEDFRPKKHEQEVKNNGR